jgi:hypothetical protein
VLDGHIIAGLQENVLYKMAMQEATQHPEIFLDGVVDLA